MWASLIQPEIQPSHTTVTLPPAGNFEKKKVSLPSFFS
jgi:hypothetical protein